MSPFNEGGAYCYANFSQSVHQSQTTYATHNRRTRNPINYKLGTLINIYIYNPYHSIGQWVKVKALFMHLD